MSAIKIEELEKSIDKLILQARDLEAEIENLKCRLNGLVNAV